MLSQHPDVRENVVIVREDAPGDKQLVAYVVGRATVRPDVVELRQFLQQRLPTYMLPATIIVLDALPLTVNGKIDRYVLPIPGNTESQEQVYIAPRTQIEQLIADIWCKILNCQRVSIFDSFFDIGGHSLLATQLIARIRNVLCVDVMLNVFFTEPTIAGLAQHIEQGLRSAHGTAMPAMKPLVAGESKQLSFAQQRLWFLNQLEPDSTAYMIPLALRLKGNLHEQVFEQSVREIIRRHEVLRTTIREEAGQPVISILDVSDFHLRHLDFSQKSQEQQEELLAQVLQNEGQRPFDFEREFLVRCILVHLNEREHVFFLCVHHIVWDGWSVGVFLKELSALYSAYCRGEASPLSELAIQYADFASWQRNWLQGEVMDAQIAYWQQQLQHAETLNLPTDRPRAAIQSYRGAHQKITLPAALKKDLQQLSQREGVTLFMTLLAAFQVLLSRYSYQEDISVGTPIANRTAVEVEALLGFFVNTLVLRTDLSEDPTFAQVMQRVRKVALDAYAYQDVPFEKLVEVLQPERDPGRSPLFQVLFSLQNLERVQEELPDLQVSTVDLEQKTTKFDLSMLTFEDEQSLTCVVEYNTDLFDEETISRLLGHWFTLLSEISENPAAKLSSLTILTPAEKRTLIEDWSTTSSMYPIEATIQQLFEEQVKRNPQAVALKLNDEALTYQELNEQANRVAHALRSHRIGPESIVGISTERSIAMIVGILGILKAGGAYLPFDPAYPAERLTFLMEDAHISLLLRWSENDACLVGSGVPEVFITDCLSSDLYSHENPSHLTDVENLAYVMYTSGSTGEPKGVMVSHANVVRLITVTAAHFAFDHHDVWTLFHSYAFDFSVWEIWGALLHGGSLVVVPFWISRSPDLFYQLLNTHQVTVLNQTPSAFNQLMQVEHVAEQRQQLALRLVIFGGEALELQSLRPWFAIHGDQQPQLVNMYGITETTVHVTYRPIREIDLHNNLGSVIGQPISDLHVVIMDRYGQPAPIGVAGEMYVGGSGVTRGYLNRPELTAQHFVPHPLSDEPGARLYRSGDLARRLPNGDIEYLGRIDHQVKIRGFRIELGEIEAALAQHPAVRDTVVLARLRGNDKQLVAYVVPKDGTVTVAELRTFLHDRLPEYMMPAHILFLDTLPLTVNGKIDRRALPEPEEQSGSLTQMRAAKNLIEEVLVDIWQSVLDRQRVGVYDNFFEIGGHSLLATQLVARIRTFLKIDVPLRMLFEAPTIALLAQQIEIKMETKQELTLPPPIISVPHERAPLSFAQQRLWFLEQLEPGNIAYTIPLALRLRGVVQVEAMQRTVAEIVRRHEVLRTHFEVHNGQPCQVIEPASSFVLQAGRVEHADAVASLVEQEAQLPFDLEQGPLFRAQLLQLAEQEFVLLLTLHHSIADGWSMSVLVDELSQLYMAFVQGKSSPLAELPLQYADYAIWQRKWLQGEALDVQLAYWKNRLAGVEPLDLPLDHARPAVQSHRGASQRLVLSPEVSQKLKQLSQQQGVTLFMTLLAAWQVLLSRYSRQEDISVGTPIANRTQREIEGLIGFFVNTLVLRTDLSGSPSFVEVLQRVKEVALGAYAHQDIPFEKLVEVLQPERDQSRTPLFQVIFGMQHVRDENATLPGLSIGAFGNEQKTSKFDLSLTVVETTQDLLCEFEYNTDLFERETITRMLGHWRTLLESIVQHPEQRLNELSLLTEPEREQILRSWNATDAAYEYAASMPSLFEALVDADPLHRAVIFEGQNWSYQELDRRANQLSNYLRAQGIGRGQLVGVCLDRSLEMVVSILAILKSGAAYVPLDPTYPVQRLEYMLQTANIQLVLSQHHVQERIQLKHEHVVAVDTQWSSIAQEFMQRPGVEVWAQDLAYIIFTSGSTGHPKGVLVPHYGLMNLVEEQQGRFDLTPDDHILQFSSISFDAFVWEMVMALCTGATLCLGTKDTLMAGPPLVDLICTHRVSMALLPPSVLAQLDPDDVPTLTKIVVGGEACSEELMRRWAEPGKRRFYNAYGPTECTVYATIMECTPDLERRPPIGYPIRRTQVYLLDQYYQPVPIGVPGELYIGGVGLAWGYLQQQGMTASRFIPHPFSSQPGARLYRTGDLTRYLPDGSIEFLGRIDHQVKVRGLRIELGEIEDVLNEHEAVIECCVIVREDRPGNKLLVAYVVSQHSARELVPQLRALVSEKLPDYMMPTAFSLLEELPLTPNGKVNRKALPMPDTLEDSDEKIIVLPRTQIEELLLATWRSVLGRKQISIEDNFFELGGHSLLATQLWTRLRRAFGIQLPLRSLFEAVTIASQSTLVEVALRAEQQIEPLALVPVSREQKLPLSFSQRRLWFLDKLHLGDASSNIPLAIKLSGTLNVDALRWSIQEIVKRHENLRTTFLTIDGEAVQVIAPTNCLCALPLVDLSAWDDVMREQQAKVLMRQEAQRPFNLEQDMLIRTSLIRLNEQEHIFLVTMHHIIFDGWSIGVFSYELQTLYQAYLDKKDSPLAPLAIQYADFAVWQRQWLQGQTLDAHLTYWQQRLAGAHAYEYPLDHPRPELPSQRGSNHTFNLSTELLQSVQEFSQQQGVTLYMTLLAAFMMALSRTTGDDDITVGTDIANRTSRETEALIGFFVNLLALRVDLGGAPTFYQVLERVRNCVLGAYTYQDLPYDMLVDHLHIERLYGQTPLINCLFVLHNIPVGEVTPLLEQEPQASLTMTELSNEVTTAKFDFAVFLAESAEGLAGSITYRTDLFERASMERLISHFINLLKQSLERPDVVIADLEMYSEEEELEQEKIKQERRSNTLRKLSSTRGNRMRISGK